MQIAPRRLWGWEPVQRLERDEDGWRIVTEPEFDKEQYELLVALHEHEASLGDHGQPLDETTSPLADPMNPRGTHMYVAEPVKDQYDAAIEEAQRDPRYSGENHSSARKWRVRKVMR